MSSIYGESYLVVGRDPSKASKEKFDHGWTQLYGIHLEVFTFSEKARATKVIDRGLKRLINERLLINDPRLPRCFVYNVMKARRQ